jgi:5-methylcytosine-specific restriction endonuclease McrA
VRERSEHIIPRAKGGENELDNLAIACPRCNSHKGEKTHGYDELTGQFVPLFHPRRDDWSTHFRLNFQTGLIEGITPSGRATVRELRFNEAAAIAMRQLLIGHGIWK